MGTLSKGTGAVAGISQRQGRYKRSAPAFLIILAALVLLLGYSMILSVCTGIAGGSFKVFAETVMCPAKASGVGMIMLEMRMPRALAAGLTGMAFALSGAVMQGITRNPLSDAGLLGINAGAGFFVALYVHFLSYRVGSTAYFQNTLSPLTFFDSLFANVSSTSATIDFMIPTAVA